MAKIILTKAGALLQEIPLVKQRINIGRRAHNDVVIEDIAISGEHLVIHTSFSESVLEDLNSTNGTLVNGQPIKKHFLQHQDVIELAEYKMRYLADSQVAESPLDFTVDPADIEVRLSAIIDINGIDPEKQCATAARTTKPRSGCAIRFLTGANAGKEIDLAKPLTTLGQPGLQVAAIARHADGYGLTHVEGNVYPLVNGNAIGTDACLMSHGDVIDMAGIQMKFLTG